MHRETTHKRLRAYFLYAFAFVGVITATAACALVFARPVSALDPSKGTGIWYDHRTIIYTDSQGNIITFTEDAKKVDTSSPGTTIFEAESYSQYHNAYPKDTDACMAFGLGPDDPIGRLLIANNGSPDNFSPIAANEQFFSKINKMGLFGNCGVTSGGQGGSVTMKNNRPQVPAKDKIVGTAVWLTPYSIGTTSGININTSGLAQSTFPINTEFDETSATPLNSTTGAGNMMELSPLFPPATTTCASFGIQLDVSPYQSISYATPTATKDAPLYAQLYIGHQGQIEGSCEHLPAGWIAITNPRIAEQPANVDPDVTGTWITSTTIQLNGAEFVNQGVPDGTVFNQLSLNGSILVLGFASPQCGNANNTMQATPYLLTPYVELSIIGRAKAGAACGSVSDRFIKMTNPNPNALVDNTPPATTSGSTNSAADSCPIEGTGLSFFLCPIFTLAQDAVKGLNAGIQNLLFINVDQIFNDNFRTSFNVFRNVGLALLVIAGLVMVISQAAGMEIFSAYAIRKALPRIVVAAIGMSLSWQLLQFAVTFFNDLGIWVTDIILSAAPPTFAGSYGNIGAYIVGTMFTVAGGGALLLFTGWGILGGLSFLLSVVLGLLVGYFILVIRQLVIIVAVLFAPLAIAASILPGTEKLYKFWRDTILGALLMFPIIMGFLAAGGLLAAVSGAAARSAVANGGTGGSSSTALGIVALIAYFAPYFMLPLAFRMASGLMGNIFGMVNDRSKGIFDSLRKGRQQERANNRHALSTGTRFSTNSPLRAFDAVGRRAGVGLRGRFGFGESGRTALSLQSGAEVERTLKSNPHLQQLSNDDDANNVLGLSGGSRAGAVLAARRLFGNSADGIARGDRAVAAAAAVGFNRANATAALFTMAQNNSRAVAAGDVGVVQEGINRLAGGNMALANSLAYGFQFNSRQAKRMDLGGAWHTEGVRANAESMFGAAGAAAVAMTDVDRAVVTAARAGGATAVSVARAAGIASTMVTGQADATARAITTATTMVDAISQANTLATARGASQTQIAIARAATSAARAPGATLESVTRATQAAANAVSFQAATASRDIDEVLRTGGATVANVADTSRAALAHATSATDIRAAVSNAAMLDGFDRTELSAIARSHGNSMNAALEAIDYGLQYGTSDQQITAAHHILELQSSLPYATEGNKEAINKWMRTRGFTVGARTTLARQVALVLTDPRNGINITARTTREGYFGATPEQVAGQLDAEARVYGQEAYRNSMSGTS